MAYNDFKISDIEKRSDLIIDTLAHSAGRGFTGFCNKKLMIMFIECIDSHMKDIFRGQYSDSRWLVLYDDLKIIMKSDHFYAFGRELKEWFDADKLYTDQFNDPCARDVRKAVVNLVSTFGLNAQYLGDALYSIMKMKADAQRWSDDESYARCGSFNNTDLSSNQTNVEFLNVINKYLSKSQHGKT